MCFGFRLNANPLPIPYNRPIPVNRLSNGNMVMIPPSSPRKMAVGNKYGAEKSKPYKSPGKNDIVPCKYNQPYNL